MLCAMILFSRQDGLIPGLVFLGAALLFLVWTYRRAPVHPAVRTAGVALKLLGITTLVVCLLEPLWSGQRARPGFNQVIVLADNSESLQLHDRGQAPTRGDALRALLTGDRSAWRDSLNQDFQVRRYMFDTRLKSSVDFTELGFDGRATGLGAALHALAELYRGQPTAAGVLLFTDGNATDLRGPGPMPDGLPPIYPVIMGNDEAIRDIAINQVSVSQTVFEDAPVTVQATVSAFGYAGAKIVARLLDRFGTPVEQQTQPTRQDEETLAFRFQIRPSRAGLSFYRLQVSSEEELDQFANPKISTEATLANNTRMVAVDSGQGACRILYVTGRPNWEYKFLKRALDVDPQIQLVGLIRIALREPKFDFRGRRGESSNPLFRGFDQKDELTERYDQPVLVRLNTRDELELRGGFPKTPEELYAYHAIILDDLEAGFFTQDQHALVQRFVSERGGGLLMLGGQESFQPGKYQRTPIGDLLPVYLDPIEEPKVSTSFKFTLTQEGWLQPWARLRNNETEEKARIEDMPPFEVLNPLRGVKPGASVMATVTGASGKTYPALVTQRFGKGRVGALTVGDWWRWGLQNPELHRDMDKSWRQMVRWLVSDVPERIELQVEPKPGDPNQAVELQVRVRDPKFQPLDNAAVSFKVQRIQEARPGTNVVFMAAEPALGEPGLYQAAYIPRETAGYQVDVVVTNDVGAEIGRARTGWTADLAGDEFRRLKPNRALLESIARQTGGEVIAAADLDAFARKLPFRKMPITEAWTLPLWHRPEVFLFVLACFVIEWGLRRWKGLP
jgi:uncharacterized membrane protein